MTVINGSCKTEEIRIDKAFPGFKNIIMLFKHCEKFSVNIFAYDVQYLINICDISDVLPAPEYVRLFLPKVTKKKGILRFKN